MKFSDGYWQIRAGMTPHYVAFTGKILNKSSRRCRSEGSFHRDNKQFPLIRQRDLVEPAIQWQRHPKHLHPYLALLAGFHQEDRA